jgi:hypothetical protein
MAAKKKPIKKQLSGAKKKVKGTGVLMTKKEREELLGMTPTKKKAPAKKKAVKRKK